MMITDENVKRIETELYKVIKIYDSFTSDKLSNRKYDSLLAEAVSNYVSIMTITKEILYTQKMLLQNNRHTLDTETFVDIEDTIFRAYRDYIKVLTFIQDNL